jgi:hypothetical protein
MIMRPPLASAWVSGIVDGLHQFQDAVHPDAGRPLLDSLNKVGIAGIHRFSARPASLLAWRLRARRRGGKLHRWAKGGRDCSVPESSGFVIARVPGVATALNLG